MTPETRFAGAGGPALRVLQLNFHYGWGGQPQYILTLAREMLLRGHQPAIAAPATSVLAQRARQAGIEVFGRMAFRSPTRPVSFIRDVRELRAVLRSFRPDILHSHGSQDTWVVVAANRWLGGPRLPHVRTRHNTKRVADSAANRYLYGRAVDMLIVVSASVLDRYRPFIDRGLLDPSGVPVIHAPVDLEKLGRGTDPARVRKELGLSDADRLVGCVGRLVRDKGQAHLLAAAALLRERHPRAFYVLVGVGTEERNLRRLVDQLGLADRVFFLGFREDIADITAALDVSVLPSVGCDASSTVIKEAMALERPVVATDIGGAREILSPDRAGLVVPPADAHAMAEALDRILSDPDASRRLGAQGRQIVVEEFTPGRQCDLYVKAYRSLLERRPPQPGSRHGSRNSSSGSSPAWEGSPPASSGQRCAGSYPLPEPRSGGPARG
ncbi:MAG: hypothetical protein DMF49_03685 [Acidobacteria bacterium]|nr:MAG: hypothetical protein DMF49_03685 [Acidobacteriota bacterium]